MLKRIKDFFGVAISREAPELKMVQSMQKLEVRDGDIIVVRHPLSLEAGTILRMRAVIQEIFMMHGFNIKVVIFDEGMDIGILRREVSQDGH